MRGGDLEYLTMPPMSPEEEKKEELKRKKYELDSLVEAIVNFKNALDERINKPFNATQLLNPLFSKPSLSEDRYKAVIDYIKNIDTTVSVSNNTTIDDMNTKYNTLKGTFLVGLRDGRKAFEGSKFNRIKRLFETGKDSKGHTIDYRLPGYIEEAGRNSHMGGRRRNRKTRHRRRTHRRRRHTRR